jgi:hypothetical protein
MELVKKDESGAHRAFLWVNDIQGVLGQSSQFILEKGEENRYRFRYRQRLSKKSVVLNCEINVRFNNGWRLQLSNNCKRPTSATEYVNTINEGRDAQQRNCTAWCKERQSRNYIHALSPNFIYLKDIRSNLNGYITKD